MKKNSIFIMALVLIFSTTPVVSVYAANNAVVTANEKVCEFDSKNAKKIYPVKNGNGYSWIFQISMKSKVDLNMQTFECHYYKGNQIVDTHVFTDYTTPRDSQYSQLKAGEIFNHTQYYPMDDSYDRIEFVLYCLDKNGKQVTLKNSFVLVNDLTKAKDPEKEKAPERDLTKLRHNANFEVEVSDGVYWVPARALGKSRYTNDEIKAMIDKTPEEKQKAISTLYEAIQLYQLSNFKEADDNVRISESNVNWEHHKPGYHAVRTNEGCCASSSNWLNFILKNDYDEIGFIWTSDEDLQGHVFNYIKDNGWYYFIDMTHYRTDFHDSTATETGNMSNYIGSDIISGNIHKTKSASAYVDYIIAAYNVPPVLASIYTATDCIPIGITSNRNALYMDYEVNTVYKDPNGKFKYELTNSPKETPAWSSTPSFDFTKLQ